MTLRLKPFLMGLFALIATALLVLAPAQAKTALGGYQEFLQVESGLEAPIQLASLGNFDWSAKTASEYANAPNNAVPSSWTQLNLAGALINRPTGFTTYRTPDGDMVHVSPSGLQYGRDPKFGNRVDHVLDHTSPTPGKPKHTVFNAQGDDALALVDEAWSKKGSPLSSDPGAYVVPMGRAIGTSGETSIRVIVKPGTNEIITAYPH